MAIGAIRKRKGVRIAGADRLGPREITGRRNGVGGESRGHGEAFGDGDGIRLGIRARGLVANDSC